MDDKLSKKYMICSSFVWLSCIWVVWQERNARIFQQKEALIHHLLEKVKLQSFQWLKANHSNFAFSCHIWWINSSYVYELLFSEQFVGSDLCSFSNELVLWLMLLLIFSDRCCKWFFFIFVFLNTHCAEM